MLLCVPPSYPCGHCEYLQGGAWLYYIDYKGFGLTKHISKVLGTNNFMAIKLDQIKQICIKIEISGNNDIFISIFTNMVERK